MKKNYLYYFEMQLRTRDLEDRRRCCIMSEVFVWQQPEQLCGVPLHICIRKVIAHLHKEVELLLLYGSNKLGVVLLAKAYLTRS